MSRREVVLDAPPSEHARAVAAMFGLALRVRRAGAAHASAEAQAIASRLERRLAPGVVVAIVGPSGSGKSSALRELRRRLGGAVVEPRPVPGRLAPIDAVRGSVGERLRRLTRAGLADATVLARPARTLSDGERWRLTLAVALARAEKAAGVRTRTTLLADEFAASLDPVTARTAAALAARAVRTGGRVAMVVATGRHELLGALQPDTVVRLELGGGWRFDTRTNGGETCA